MTDKRKKRPEETETGSEAGFDSRSLRGDLRETGDPDAATRVDPAESHAFFSFSGQLEIAPPSDPPPELPGDAEEPRVPETPAAPEASAPPETATKSDVLSDLSSALAAPQPDVSTASVVKPSPSLPRAPTPPLAPPPAPPPAAELPLPAIAAPRPQPLPPEDLPDETADDLALPPPAPEPGAEPGAGAAEARSAGDWSEWTNSRDGDAPTLTDIFRGPREAEPSDETLDAAALDAAEPETSLLPPDAGEEPAEEPTATFAGPSLFRRMFGWARRLFSRRYSDAKMDEALETRAPEETDSSLLESLQRYEQDPRTEEAAPAPAEAAEPPAAEPDRPARPAFRERMRAAATRLRAALVRLLITGRKESPEPRERKSAIWWRRTLTEIGALFLLIVPLELLFHAGRIGAFGAHPHPYWIVVLPMAGARGAVAGLVAATVASLLYAIGAMQALARQEFLSIFDLKTMLEPLLFYGVGFFVGELHDEFAGRFRKVERNLKDVQERNQRLRHERDVLADANKMLEKRIVDASLQFGNLILAATRIENAGRREIFEVALEMVEEHCGASGSVLLLLDQGALDLIAHRGWPDDEVPRRIGDARSSPLVTRAIEKGQPVNGLATDEAPPKKGPLVVAPLFDASGVVKALLCLDEVPPARLNESTVTLFFAIAEWTSACLQRAKRGAAAAASMPSAPAPIADPSAWIGTPADLGERLRLEYERCARYGVPTSVLAIQAPEWMDNTPDGIEQLDRYVRMVFTGGLRPSDALYRFGYPGCYMLILAGTTTAGAEVVRGRLLRRVDYTPNTEIGPVEIAATGPDTESPDLPSLAARVAQQFRAASKLALEGECPVPFPSRARVGSLDDFVRRIRVETSLAVRQGFELHVVGISGEVLAAGSAGILARHIEEVGVDILRPTDGVYALGPHHCALVLPCTGEEEAAAAAHRLVLAVRRRDPDAVYGQLETQVMALGPHHPDGTSFLESLAKKRPVARFDPDAETDA